MSTVISSVRDIPLAALTFSITPAQKERRAHFDKAALTELADSIKSHGLVQPILVRPFRDEHVVGEVYEVVAGERRALAAKQAGLDAITATVRELTDEQVLELQLIENLQRQDLHELAEAEGYEALQKLGHSIEDMAAKTGKSKATIYARMKLLALCKEGRAHFYGGNLSASSALLLARLPEPVQKKALKDVTVRENDGPMSYREVSRILQQHYMLQLSDAPFDTKAEDLVKGAVACGRCPKNTIAQPELFGDVKANRAGVCTDPPCFKAKTEAHGRLLLAQARGNGQKIIAGAEAKKIVPYSHSDYLSGGYAQLDQECYDDPKHRTYQEILGKDYKPAVLQKPDGQVVEVAPKADAVKKLKADGVIKPVKREASATDKAEKKSNTLLLERLWAAIHAKAPVKLPRESFAKLVGYQLDIIGGLPDAFEKLWELQGSGKLPEPENLSEANLNKFAWELLIAEEVQYSSDEGLAQLSNLAKSLKIDVKKLRDAVAAEEKAAAPAKPAKRARKAK